MLYDSEKGEITAALGGDLNLSRRLAVYREERFLQVRELLRQADVGFMNLESSVHRYGDGTPTIKAGPYITTEPPITEDIKWMGINLLSCANNHCYDYGEEGVLINNRYLDEAGITHAGTGRNLREAASPAYRDTANGRVALVAATSMFPEWYPAKNQRVDMPGKPGVNPLGFQTTYVLPPEAWQGLRLIGRGLPFDADRERARAFGFFTPAQIGTATDTEYTFLGRRFVPGDQFAVHTNVNERDADENLRQIGEARRQADLVIFSLHNHEMGGPTLWTAKTRDEMERPADFVFDFAHRAIDEGADIFVCHGPHVPLGIEIYQGKPIFCSLGNFCMQYESARFLPAHAYESWGLDPMSTPADFFDALTDQNRRAHPGDPLNWQTVLAVCRFGQGKLAELSLYPLDLGYGRPRAQRGRPLLADPEMGQQILSRIARLSADLGTKIELRDGQGVVADH